VRPLRAPASQRDRRHLAAARKRGRGETVGVNADSDCPLTPRQSEVLALLAEGLTYQQIALRRGRSASTIRSQVHEVIVKLGVRDRAQAVITAFRHGWLDLDVSRGELGMLHRLLAEIRDALQAGHRREGREPLSISQHRYLQAFDEHLRARTDTEKADTRLEMGRQLHDLCDDAGVTPRPGRPQRDLVELLVQHAVGG
jgi:DNA-binding CsgD family transcriptional regulator